MNAGRFDDVLAVVTNYDFSEQADDLKRMLAPRMPTLLVDASSPRTPALADRVIPNSYYPGLWNEAVRCALERGSPWLLFCASDVTILDPDLFFYCVAETLSTPWLGVWTPGLTPDSHFEYRDCGQRPRAGLRRASIVEGFFFLCRTDLLEAIHPANEANRLGWGLDSEMCYEAVRRGLQVAVDDRCRIHHPQSAPAHRIDRAEAWRQMQATLRPGVLDWLVERRRTIEPQARTLGSELSLDLGCGPQPRNPFGATQLKGIDRRGNADGSILGADLALEPIPFDNCSIDYVTAYDFIEHVPRIIYAPEARYAFVELMNEVHRVLRPGGIFLSFTPAIPHGEAFRDPTHVNFITDETFPLYFCGVAPWARMYGFEGTFDCIGQEWHGPHLLSLLRRLEVRP